MIKKIIENLSIKLIHLVFGATEVQIHKKDGTVLICTDKAGENDIKKVVQQCKKLTPDQIKQLEKFWS